jgi:hypothetical protein
MSLTIDRIVKKYASLLWAASPPDARQIERFRSDLVAQSRADQITSYLSLFGSFERALPLFGSTFAEPPDVFWTVFLENWSICDGFWSLRQDLLSTLRKRKAELSPIGSMNPADRDFYDRIPESVPVFRGCTRRRARGLSWTTDRERAEFFARGGRFGTQADPVIASAEIAKVDLFFVSTARKEDEVVLDPYAIRRLRLGIPKALPD